jgi:FixJ family two-component response regulator
VEVFRRHADEIGCVVLDLTMPRMDGRQAFHEISAMRPGVPVIICSGYTRTEIDKRFAGHAPPGFIQKPYQVSDLLAQIRTAMSGRG